MAFSYVIPSLRGSFLLTREQRLVFYLQLDWIPVLGNQDLHYLQPMVVQLGHTEHADCLFTLPPTHIIRIFIIADVTRPLLGPDFLRSNSLLIDLKGK